MIIPIRCFTCGKVIGNKWEAYLGLLQVEPGALTAVVCTDRAGRVPGGGRTGRAGAEALLLPENAARPCRPHRETAQLRPAGEVKSVKKSNVITVPSRISATLVLPSFLIDFDAKL